MLKHSEAPEWCAHLDAFYLPHPLSTWKKKHNILIAECLYEALKACFYVDDNTSVSWLVAQFMLVALSWSQQFRRGSRALMRLVHSRAMSVRITSVGGELTRSLDECQNTAFKKAHYSSVNAGARRGQA